MSGSYHPTWYTRLVSARQRGMDTLTLRAARHVGINLVLFSCAAPGRSKRRQICSRKRSRSVLPRAPRPEEGRVTVENVSESTTQTTQGDDLGRRNRPTWLGPSERMGQRLPRQLGHLDVATLTWRRRQGLGSRDGQGEGMPSNRLSGNGRGRLYRLRGLGSRGAANREFLCRILARYHLAGARIVVG